MYFSAATLLFGVMKDFDTFEQQFTELIGEFQLISISENRLRDALRAEATRAAASEAALEGAERVSADARSSAAAATAGATQAAAALATAQDDLTGLKMQLELAERQRTLLEERCTQMSAQISCLERELQILKPLQPAHSALQRQYAKLQDRVRGATDDARKESSRLEAELRRVERCAGGGSEVRERARLAAAAHARERRFAAAELQHTTRELLRANTEIARLSALTAELQQRLVPSGVDTQSPADQSESIQELRAALEASNSGSSRLERALAAALADNAVLAASLHASDNVPTRAQLDPTPPDAAPTNICAIDSFLAD